MSMALQGAIELRPGVKGWSWRRGRASRSRPVLPERLSVELGSPGGSSSILGIQPFDKAELQDDRGRAGSAPPWGWRPARAEALAEAA
jgi:hypothetical protein